MVGVRKGAWAEEEDMLLRKCIEKHGEGKWHQVPLRAGLNRCRKSCRLRWLNYLRPNIKRGNFSLDEVDLILRLHSLLGNRWSLIAGRLPGRTANDVKNYWNTHQCKKHFTSPAREEEGGNYSGKTSETSKISSYRNRILKPQPRTFSKVVSLTRGDHIINKEQKILTKSNDDEKHVHHNKEPEEEEEEERSGPTPAAEDVAMQWWESLFDNDNNKVEDGGQGMIMSSSSCWSSLLKSSSGGGGGGGGGSISQQQNLYIDDEEEEVGLLTTGGVKDDKLVARNYNNNVSSAAPIDDFNLWDLLIASDV